MGERRRKSVQGVNYRVFEVAKREKAIVTSED